MIKIATLLSVFIFTACGYAPKYDRHITTEIADPAPKECDCKCPQATEVKKPVDQPKLEAPYPERDPNEYPTTPKPNDGKYPKDPVYPKDPEYPTVPQPKDPGDQYPEPSHPQNPSQNPNQDPCFCS